MNHKQLNWLMDRCQACWCYLNLFWIKENMMMLFNHLTIPLTDLCPMAVKIIQLENFCTHSKILGGYQIR